MPVPSEHDCSYNDNACLCPYCGEEDSASWELIGDSGTTTCGHCGRDYTYERIVSVCYSTSPIMGPHQLSGCYLRDDADNNPVET